MVKYEIIRDVATINDNGIESLELKYIKWGNNTPKYDLRKWKDETPLKGVTLSDEEAKILCEVLLSEFEIKGNPNGGNVPLNEVELPHPIDYRTFFVKKSMYECRDKGHNYVEVLATVPMLIGNTYKNIEFPAIYCYDCNVYYVTTEIYNKLHNNGRILCQLLTEEEYRKYKNGFFEETLSQKGPLKLLGYTVAKNTLSDGERRQLLSWIIANEIMTKTRVIEYLDFFIRITTKQSNKTDAITKWREDKDFLKGVSSFGKNAPPMGVIRFVE